MLLRAGADCNRHDKARACFPSLHRRARRVAEGCQRAAVLAPVVRYRELRHRRRRDARHLRLTPVVRPEAAKR